MDKRQSDDTTSLAINCGTTMGTVIGTLNKRTREIHAQGKVTLGVPFGMLGSMLGFWLSANITIALGFALFFGTVGAIIAGVVNRRREKTFEEDDEIYE